MGGTIMKIAILAAAFAVLALPATADESKGPPVDRAAAVARAPQFHDQVEAALTKKPNDLYLAALTGSASDQWAWGLALVAERYDTTSVPPAQLATYKAYSSKVSAARSTYAKSHPNEDVSGKPMDFFVQPTPDEMQAATLVQSINGSKGWFDRAQRGGIDRVVLEQSERCLTNVKGDINAEDLVNQMMTQLGDIEAADKPAAPAGKGPPAPTLAEVLNKPKTEAEKTDLERDNDALCGGADAYQHVKTLMKAVYKPTMKITLSGPGKPK